MARGSIEQRGDRKWRLVVSDGSDPFTGKRRKVTRTITARNQREAEKALTALLREVDLGRHAAADANVAQMLERWIAARGDHWSPKTRNERVATIARHITPRLGTLPLWRLTPAVLDGAYGDMLRAGVGRRTIGVCHQIISAACNWAVRGELLARNPAIAASPPPNVRVEPSSPDPQALRALIAVARDRLRLALIIDAGTGLRRGELVGLRWSDIDTENSVLTVARAVVDGGPVVGLVVKSTKTARVRRLALGATALEALRRARLEQIEAALACGIAWSDERYVLATDVEGVEPCRPDYLTHAFARARKKAGLSGIKLHHVRHFVATELLAAGVDPKTVQSRLGHASATMTMDVYAHAVPARDRAAAEHLEQLLG